MKKLKYFLLTLCAVVMCACCFSFKTNKVEAADIDYSQITISQPKITVKDGQAGYSLTVNLSNEVLSLLNKNLPIYETSIVNFSSYYELIIVCDYSGSSYNSIQIKNVYSEIDNSCFAYYDYSDRVSFITYTNKKINDITTPYTTNLNSCYENRVVDNFINTLEVFIPHQRYTMGDYYSICNYTFYAFVYDFGTTKPSYSSYFDSYIKYKSNTQILSSNQNFEDYLSFTDSGILKDNIPTAEAYLKALGIYKGVETKVMITYKGFDDDGKIVDKYVRSSIPEFLKLNKSYVHNDVVFSGVVENFKNLADFNIVYNNEVVIGGDGLVDSVVIMQALEEYECSYSSTGDIIYYDVKYSPYMAQNFAIRIISNDIETANYYTSVHTSDWEYTDDGYLKLIYSYSYLANVLLNRYSWSIDVGFYGNDFMFNDTSIVNLSDPYENTIYSCTLSIDKDNLIISVPTALQENLKNISIKMYATPVEPYEVEAYIKYKELVFNNGIFEYLEHTIDLSKELFLSDGILHNVDVFIFEDKNKILETFPEVLEVLQPNILNGAVYMTVSEDVDVVSDEKGDVPILTFIVQYNYKSVFMVSISDGNTTKTTFVNLTTERKTYSTNWFVDTCDLIGSNYYISDLKISSLYAKLSNVSYDNNKKIQTYILDENLNDGIIIPVIIQCSNAVFVEFNYYERYNLSPFAIKRKFSNFVSLDVMGNLENINVETVERILGVSTTAVFENQISVSKVKTSFDGDISYTLSLAYSNIYVSGQNYDNTKFEIPVQLTSYADWCKMMGVNWSIMSLNTSNNRYFSSPLCLDKTLNEDENRELVYGLFSTCVFEEKVSDFAGIFHNVNTSGCVVYYNSIKVSGSSIYKYFGGLYQSGNIIQSALGYAGMCICELANDDNKIYENYFFYVNVFDDTPFINQEPENPFDLIIPDSPSVSTILTYILVILGGIVALIILLLIIRFCIWLFKGVGNTKPSKPSSGGSSQKSKKKNRKKIKGGKNKRE